MHTAVGFLIISLLTLLQVKYQNFGNPFQTNGATMLLFIVAVIGYNIALAWTSQPAPNSSYLPILRRVCFIFGAYSCDLLLSIIVPPFGWLVLFLCVCMSLQLLYYFMRHTNKFSYAFNKFSNQSISLLQRCSTYRMTCSEIASNHSFKQRPEHPKVLRCQLPTQVRNKWRKWK